MSIERAKSFEEAKTHEEFEKDGYVWLKIDEDSAALIVDEAGDPLKVEYKEH